MRLAANKQVHEGVVMKGVAMYLLLVVFDDQTHFSFEL